MKIISVLMTAMLAFAGSPVWAESEKSPPDKKAKIAKESFKILPGYVLNISVYPQAELSGRRITTPDGGVVLPTIGRIEVGGLTIKQAKRKLEKELSRYFRKPQVSLTVVKFSRRHVILTGEIKAPGLIRFVSGMTLSETIVNASGFTGNADRKHVRVYRGPPKDQEIKIVNVDAILAQGDLASDFPLEPGDRVEVPRRVNQVFIWGAVQNAGAYDFFAGMKLLDVITRANGIGVYAKTDSVRIFREGGEVFDVDFKSVLEGDLRRDITLRPGDIIYIPSTSLARASDKINLIQPWLAILNLFGTAIALFILL